MPPGLYRKLRVFRNLYLRRSLWQRTAQWREFYSQFVSPGDLVFDIGANRGDRTETFVGMGARVVAVEPIPGLAVRLKRIFRYSKVDIEAVGVGRIAGSLPMHLCSTAELSSFSGEFVAERSKENPHMNWEQTQIVPIVTLDSLIDKYGHPSFIKIDVEGFEDAALAGLTRPVTALSFEVRPEDLRGRADDCMRSITSLGSYEFNLSLEERGHLDLPSWSDAQAVMASISGVGGNWNYADIYARRCPA